MGLSAALPHAAWAVEKQYFSLNLELEINSGGDELLC